MPTPTDSERATPQADLAARRDYSVRRPTFDVWPLLLVVVLAVLSGLLVLALMQYQRTERLAEGERLTNAFAAMMDEQTARTLQTLKQRMALIGQLLLAPASKATAIASRRRNTRQWLYRLAAVPAAASQSTGMKPGSALGSAAGMVRSTNPAR